MEREVGGMQLSQRPSMENKQDLMGQPEFRENEVWRAKKITVPPRQSDAL